MVSIYKSLERSVLGAEVCFKNITIPGLIPEVVKAKLTLPL